MDLNEFQQFLTSFLQNNDEIVKKSEEIYQSSLADNPSAIITLHFQNILSFISPNLVALSIILLKRAFIVIDTNNLLSCLNKDTIDFISTTIPDLFTNENFNPYLFSLLVDASSYIAKVLMPCQIMLDFIPKLIKIAKIMSPLLSPPAINCIVQCNNYFPLANYEINEEHTFISTADIFSIISVALTNDFSIDFTLSALRMLFSFYDSTSQLIEFAPVVSEIYLKIPKQQLNIALSDLYLFCNHNYIYFAQTLPILINSLLSIVANNNTNDDICSRIQTNAVSIYICLAEKFDVAFNPFLNNVTASIMIASCNFVEDPTEDIDSSAPYSDNAIYNLSEIFSSRTMYPSLVIELSKDMSLRNEWNCRRSALSALYKLLQSCENGLDTYFNDIISIIKDHFADPHYTCRYYSFCALSELCSSYSHLTSQIVEQLIPLILNVSRVENSHQAKIAELRSLESLCSNVSPESILPVAQPLLEELLPQIQNPDSTPMEQLMIIKCVSNIALSTHINFDQFYPASIVWLKTAISQINPGCEDLIRIQAIKTFPLIGKAANLQLFLNDGIEFMSFLLQSNFSLYGENEKSSVLFALQEMSEVLPNEIYFQFLPAIFNVLGIELSTEYEIEEFPLTYDISSLTDRVTIIYREKNVINAYSRSQLLLFSKCIDTMIKLTETLKDKTIPFIRPISKIVSRFVGFAVYSPLQSASIKLFDTLINLYREYDIQVLSMFLPYVRNILFPTVSNLFVNSVSILHECFDLLANSMDGSQFRDDFPTFVINTLLQLHVKRNLIIAKGASENSPDLLMHDELEISIEKFANVLMKLFTPNMIEFAADLLDSQCLIFHILFMADLYLLSTSNNVPNLVDLNQLLSIVFNSINSSRMNLSYIAFISLSKILRFTPLDQNLITQSIEKITEIIHQYEEDENDSTQKVVDGALIALSTILKITYGKMHLSSLIQVWFEQMPVLIDDFEATVAFEVLCIIVNDKNPQILNSNSIAHLLHCCSIAIKKKKIATEIHTQIVNITKALCSDEELHDIVQGGVSSLNIDDKITIQNVL